MKKQKNIGQFQNTLNNLLDCIVLIENAIDDAENNSNTSYELNISKSDDSAKERLVDACQEFLCMIEEEKFYLSNKKRTKK
jgi:hypothetical protein